MTIQLLNHDRLDDIDPAWLHEAEQIYGDDAEGLAMVYLARTMMAWTARDAPGMEAAASTWLRHSRAIGSWAFADRAEFFLRLARVQQGQSDPDLAEPLLRTARRSLTQHNMFVLSLALRALAGVAGARGKVAQATRLWMAGVALHAPSLVELHRSEAASVRRVLGDRFDAEVEAGRRLTPAEAVELAFEVCDAD